MKRPRRREVGCFGTYRGAKTKPKTQTRSKEWPTGVDKSFGLGSFPSFLSVVLVSWCGVVGYACTASFPLAPNAQVPRRRGGFRLLIRFSFMFDCCFSLRHTLVHSYLFSFPVSFSFLLVAHHHHLIVIVRRPCASSCGAWLSEPVRQCRRY